MTRLRRVRDVLTGEGGYTIVELLQVMVIMLIVLGALTALFVQASNAEFEMNRRFQAQQEARVALDKMRREIHCASLASPTGTSASITVTLPAQCPTAGGAETTVTYSTQLVSTNRYELRRDAVRVADWITTANVFAYTAPTQQSLGKLRIDFPVNPKPAETWKSWRLAGDIVLRNTARLP